MTITLLCMSPSGDFYYTRDDRDGYTRWHATLGNRSKKVLMGLPAKAVAEAGFKWVDLTFPDMEELEAWRQANMTPITPAPEPEGGWSLNDAISTILEDNITKCLHSHQVSTLNGKLTCSCGWDPLPTVAEHPDAPSRHKARAVINYLSEVYGL